MHEDNQQKFQELAYDLHAVHTSTMGSMEPYVLFIGGSASTIQGQSFLDKLRQQVLLEPRGRRFSVEDVQNMELAVQVDYFNQKWSSLGKNMRTSTLYDLQQKLQLTPGHIKLASLLKKRYFPLVLTTTLDQLVESTFISDAMRNGEPPPLWKVLINDADTTRETFQRLLQDRFLATTILKLCGSINTGSFAVTRTEVEEKVQNILSSIIGLLQRNLVIVGATQLDEIIFQQVFQAINDGRETSICYINAGEPSYELNKWLKQWDTKYIIEEGITFDVAFQTLAQWFDVFEKLETINKAPLDQANLERLRSQQGQTTDDTVVEYLKNSTPQRRTGPLSDAGTQGYMGEDQQATTVPNIETDRGPLSGTTAPVDEPLIEFIEPDENKLVNLVKDTTVVTVSIGNDRRATFTVKDRAIYNFKSKEPSDELKFNLSDLNKSMQYMGESIAAFHKINSPQGKLLRDGWRAQAKQEGMSLYKTLIQPIPELESMLAVARGTAAEEDPANVTVVFEGPRQYLSMPYELLYYRDLPMVLQHPVCRQVSGVNVRGEHFDDFFYKLRQRKGKLRVLLIASGTPGTTSDEQVLELEQVINQSAQRFGVKAVVDKLLTRQASIKAIRDRLRNCTYHIVHYAGHGVFDEVTGENSGLRFWQRENMSGERVTLTAREIASLMGACETRLFYINACVGAEVSSEQVLHGNDYLGVMDAIVQAKVPYVLGFRWYVTDRSSRYFASLFYQHFFSRPLVPEQAVLRARKQIYEEDPLNEAWSSPILVAQTPYQ